MSIQINNQILFRQIFPKFSETTLKDSMISFKSQAQFQKLLTTYLKAKNNMNSILQRLCGFYDESQYVKGIKFLQLRVQKYSFSNFHEAMKWLMLIQKLITQGFNAQKLQNLIQGVSEAINKIKCKKSSFDTLIKEKLILPYNVYLKKRIQTLPKSVTEKDVCFYLINLINASAKCTDILFLLGRYYLSQCPYAQDFNYIMADDVRGIYRVLSKKLKKIDEKEDSKSLRQLEDVIEIMHESMYTLFYNRYFYRSLINLVPTWIQFKVLSKEDFSTKHKQLDQTLHSSTISTKSNFSNTKSHKKGIKIEDVQQSLQIIQDMENFLSLCELQNIEF